MNNEEKILSLIEKMYTEFSGRFEKIDERFDKMDGRMDRIEERMDRMEGNLVRIEQDHGQKLSALFDGYKQNSDKLDRIEAEVTKHDKFILERIK